MFTKLRFGVDDVYQPAAEQFDRKGSFGNGSAMRVAPATLFAYKNKDTLIEVRCCCCFPIHGVVTVVNSCLKNYHWVIILVVGSFIGLYPL